MCQKYEVLTRFTTVLNSWIVIFRSPSTQGNDAKCVTMPVPTQLQHLTFCILESLQIV